MNPVFAEYQLYDTNGNPTETRPALLVRPNVRWRNYTENGEPRRVMQSEYVVFLSASDPAIWDATGNASRYPLVYIDNPEQAEG